MKTKLSKKFTLGKETLIALNNDEMMNEINGGWTGTCAGSGCGCGSGHGCGVNGDGTFFGLGGDGSSALGAILGV